MSSNTSILDDQTTDTNYFTALSGSSSTEDETSPNNIEGIFIIWNREIKRYDSSGEKSVDLSRIISYLSSTKEDVLFNSDTLSMIVSFLPAIDLLKLAQTCKRLGRREEGELSLHDEALFRQPPPKEDCPICFIRMPTLASGRAYMSCCGNTICSGCFYSSLHDNNGNIVDNPKCPFCRTPWHASNDEYIERTQNRVEAGDAAAMNTLGCCYRDRRYGLPQDYTKALELWRRAAELGYARADTNIGYAYSFGEGVEVDKKKARHYYKLAAMKGCTSARYNLGINEKKAGNMDRALKHYTIAAEGGDEDALKPIKELSENGHATKDDYTIALELYQTYLGEIKSYKRDQAAAASDSDRYY